MTAEQSLRAARKIRVGLRYGLPVPGISYGGSEHENHVLSKLSSEPLLGNWGEIRTFHEMSPGLEFKKPKPPPKILDFYFTEQSLKAKGDKAARAGTCFTPHLQV